MQQAVQRVIIAPRAAPTALVSTVTSNSTPAPKIPAITVGLRPFDPASDGDAPSAVSALLVTFSARPGGGARFVFTLEGRLGDLRLPEADAPPADPLWQHTCFEAFLSAPGEEGYYEYNFSPAGPWAGYRFQRYRECAGGLEDEAVIAPPVIVCERRDGVLMLETDLPSTLLPPSPVLRIGLAAVVERRDGHLEYWAVSHPAKQPDFHHASGWTLELDTRSIAQ
ncbi:MAG: DOMON-like domain-containing protein [Azoarcus sp.]|jgi:hypothetical protein|nr:DOMON-like domain-containing protein [Azoarcus sp.]